MFTQRDEETYILKFFKNTKRRFLDIGAYDGKCFSTTRALFLQGWGGVCVEPSPTVLPALRACYDSVDNVDILECAISGVNGKIDFYDSGGDMISTVLPSHAELWKSKAGCTFTKIKIDSLTVLSLFEKVGYDFSFISLDVEGTNFEIFQQFPFKKLKKTKMICVEFDYKADDVLKLVKSYGFREYHQTAENLLLTR